MKNINLKTDLFQKLTSKKGYKITKWNKGDDIKEYYSTTEVDAPLNSDISIYHSVSISEDEKLKKDREEAIKKSREEVIKQKYKFVK